jgi:recombination protein RecR
MEFSSKIVSDAVEALSGFPGIGRRTALRLVMYLLNRPEMEVAKLAESLIKLKTDLHLCTFCGNVSDARVCDICNNSSRSNGILCVVEDFSDLMAIESTRQFSGRYHVLGGLISPMDGVGPDDLSISSLVQRDENESITEVVMALSATIEGDTTLFYIGKKLKSLPVKMSCIARGISVGGEIEYADEVTLGRSILQRTEYNL